MHLFSYCLLILNCWFVFSCFADWKHETIYLTWQNQPSTTMTIQWITLIDDCETRLSYVAKNDPNQEWKTYLGTCVPLTFKSPYYLHSIELANLQPETYYNFKLSSDEMIYAFRTMPADLEKEINFVVGGDMYHEGMRDLLEKMCRQAARVDPSFALIGGDIAYAVTNRSPGENIQRWIDWIKVWHASMIGSQKELIPVIAAIGNHDIIGQYGQTWKEARVFSSLFPMPGKSLYNVLDFNDYLSVFILDSGHGNSIYGRQSQWLKEHLPSRKNQTHRFAIYHVPAYPSVRPYHERLSRDIRRHWVPLFEKERIQVVFEHHDHAYKRTHPLLKNLPHPEGIVYFGDGAWSVEEARRSSTSEKRPYLAKFASIRHFIHVQLSKVQQKFTSIDEDGNTVDHYVIPLEPHRHSDDRATQKQ